MSPREIKQCYTITILTRGPLVLYRSPECWGYAELEQTWKYKSTQCSLSCHPYRSIRNIFDPVINMVTVNPGSSFESIKPQVRGRKPQGTKFWSLWSFATSFKKHFFEVWIYTIFLMILYLFIAPGQGLTTPCGRNFDVNRNILSLRSFVASLKKIWSLI